MKRLICILAAIVTLSACGGGASAPAIEPVPHVLTAPVPCRVVGYGDSIMRNYYNDASGQVRYHADPWSKALERLVPGVVFEDRSVPGQNMRNGVEGFTHPDPQWGYVPAFNLQNRTGFDVVVVEWGVIDAWLIGMDPNSLRIAGLVDYYQHLQMLHNRITAEGKQMIITGLARQHVATGGFITTAMSRIRDDFDDIARRYAAENGVLFADIGAAQFNSASDMIDAVHPTQSYSSRMAERIAPTLHKACQNAGKL